MERLLIIGGLFVLAGLCEIGGGYLVWGWMRERKPVLWALLGALVLAAYGVVAALQPISEFGRLYAAYGGIFIALAMLCGVVVDGFRPDRWDLLGATICVVGVLVMVALPEGIERRERTLFTEVPRRRILRSSREPGTILLKRLATAAARVDQGKLGNGAAVMADDDRTNDAQANQQPPEPSPDLTNLGERLVGTWEMSGEVGGMVSYEWMEGGFFLIQHVDLEQYGQRIKGIEIIGHERPFGEEPGEEIKSRFYSNTGDTLDYVYELEGDTLTIWGGERGSPAYAESEFSEDGNTDSGEWVYPGGGGYRFTMTRVG